MSGIVRDLRHGFRLLRKWPGSSVICVITLALGIGCAIAMFCLVGGAILDPLPVRDPATFVTLWATNPRQGVNRGRVPLRDFYACQSRSTSFEGLAAYKDGNTVLAGTGAPRTIESQTVTVNFFRVVGTAP